LVRDGLTMDDDAMKERLKPYRDRMFDEFEKQRLLPPVHKGPPLCEATGGILVKYFGPSQSHIHGRVCASTGDPMDGRVWVDWDSNLAVIENYQRAAQAMIDKKYKDCKLRPWAYALGEDYVFAAEYVPLNKRYSKDTKKRDCKRGQHVMWHPEPEQTQEVPEPSPEPEKPRYKF